MRAGKSATHQLVNSEAPAHGAPGPASKAAETGGRQAPGYNTTCTEKQGKGDKGQGRGGGDTDTMKGPMVTRSPPRGQQPAEHGEDGSEHQHYNAS